MDAVVAAGDETGQDQQSAGEEFDRGGHTNSGAHCSSLRSFGSGQNQPAHGPFAEVPLRYTRSPCAQEWRDPGDGAGEGVPAPGAPGTSDIASVPSMMIDRSRLNNAIVSSTSLAGPIIAATIWPATFAAFWLAMDLSRSITRTPWSP